MTITEFLLARIAEDEAIAQRQRADLEKEFGKAVEVELFSELGREGIGHMSYPVIVVDHSRVLAECEAKRRIVEAVDVLEREKTYLSRMKHSDAEDARHVITRDILHHLAAVYADHPDFDEAWRA